MVHGFAQPRRPLRLERNKSDTVTTIMVSSRMGQSTWCQPNGAEERPRQTPPPAANFRSRPERDAQCVTGPRPLSVQIQTSVKRRTRRLGDVFDRSGREVLGDGPSVDPATTDTMTLTGSNPQRPLTAPPPRVCQLSAMLITTFPNGPRARCSNACMASSKR